MKRMHLSMIVCWMFGIGMNVNAQAPIHLTISEGFENPIGLYDSTPMFSWHLPQVGSVQRQSAYRVVVATSPDLLPDNADLWDSKMVESDQSVWVNYGGKSLDSRQRAYWQVQFQDEKGVISAWSKIAHFELGLLKTSDWKGQWIRMNGGKAITAPMVWAGKEPAAFRKSAEFKFTGAEYGNLDDEENTIDVIKAIEDQVADGEWILRVSDDLAKGQSVPLGKSQLRIEYSINGKSVRKTLDQGSMFDLFGQRTFESLVPEYLRKPFELEAPVAKARLYVTARGLFQISLNGSRVGADYMVPGWTTYRSWIETLTYDVTDQLQEGKNVIGGMIAEGWYAGSVGGPGDFPSLLCQLEITLTNGKQVVVITDDTWKATHNGPLRVSSIFDGEVYDARLEIPGWDRAGFDDSEWNPVLTEPLDPEVALTPKEHHPVRVTRELPTVEMTEPSPGRYVFDFGQNLVGWPKINLPVRAKDIIKIRVAEMLREDGNLYTDNYRAARSEACYTAGEDGVISWHPVFTFFGYRYVELTGLPEGTRPQPSWVTSCVLHSDFENTGTFSSSHPKLNKLQKNITWGQRGNFLDIPTDCPQRDERQGWTGDAQVFCPTSIFNYNVHAFWKSWFHSMREDQNDEGIIPYVVPSSYRRWRFDGGSGWGDVGVTASWDIYVRTGDLSILEDNYDMMRSWTAAYERDAEDYIVSRKGFGDWLQPYGRKIRGDTPIELITTAYFGRCTTIMHESAILLNRPADAERYEKQFAAIRKAFTKAFFDQNGKLTTESQTGYLMALGYNLVDPELRDEATGNLLRMIDEADGHLRTGFLGTPLLAFVLDETGHPDVAYSVLFKETYPSWFFSINQGATTMWERWNSYSHEDGFGSAGMNSFNHYAYGAIGEWMYERIAGLAPDPEHPGYKHFFIQPCPGGPLTSAKAEYETPYGLAKSGWRKTDDGLVIDASVPPNSTATLVVPQLKDGEPQVTASGKTLQLTRQGDQFVCDLEPGQYEFEIRWLIN